MGFVIIIARAFMKFTILVAAAAASLCGCAGPIAPVTDQSAAPELVYRTGSNIPVRRAPMTKEEKQQQAEESQRALDTIQRSGPTVTRQGPQ